MVAPRDYVIQAPEEDSRKNTTGEKSGWVPYIVSFTLTLGLVFILQLFVAQVFYIPSASMENTLMTGDRVVADKVSYYSKKPQVGDVVVFESTPSWDNPQMKTNPIRRALHVEKHYLVKRVVAQGGDVVRCLPGDTSIMVNDHTVDSSTVKTPPDNKVDTTKGSEACEGNYFGPVVVPDGHYFVLGDNRTNSADSRYHLTDDMSGTIPEKNIYGKVRWVISPMKNMGNVQ